MAEVGLLPFTGIALHVFLFAEIGFRV